MRNERMSLNVPESHKRRFESEESLSSRLIYFPTCEFSNVRLRLWENSRLRREFSDPSTERQNISCTRCKVHKFSSRESLVWSMFRWHFYAQIDDADLCDFNKFLSGFSCFQLATERFSSKQLFFGRNYLLCSQTQMICPWASKTKRQSWEHQTTFITSRYFHELHTETRENFETSETRLKAHTKWRRIDWQVEQVLIRMMWMISNGKQFFHLRHNSLLQILSFCHRHRNHHFESMDE